MMVREKLRRLETEWNTSKFSNYSYFGFGFFDFRSQELLIERRTLLSRAAHGSGRPFYKVVHGLVEDPTSVEWVARFRACCIKTFRR